MFMTLIGFSCHETYLTLVSGPTDIGGGQYSTTVEVCIGQTVNWGGTDNFTMTLNGANFVSYLPTNLTNSYNSIIYANCNGGGNVCQNPTCASITATASSSSVTNVVTYTTSGSAPNGYPIVPNDNETCGVNSTSYCFNFTFISDGTWTDISLNGNVEIQQGLIGCPCATVSQNTPCNGTYNPLMTLNWPSSLPIELIEFKGYNKGNVNYLYWISASEINNDYYFVERSGDGKNWDEIGNVVGAGTTNVVKIYDFKDLRYKDIRNYYQLTQVDFNGNSETFKTILIDNSIDPKIIAKTVNFMGQEVNEYYNGMVIEIYTDNSVRKFFRD